MAYGRPSRPARTVAFALSLLVGWRICFDPMPLRAEQPPRDHLEAVLSGDKLTSWKEGDLRYMLFEGNCLIEQGTYRVRAGRALCWLDEREKPGEPIRLQFVADGNVRVENPGSAPQATNFHRDALSTSAKLRIRSSARLNQSAAEHPLYARALEATADGTPHPSVNPGVVAADHVHFESANPQQVLQTQFAPGMAGPGAGVGDAVDRPAATIPGTPRAGGLAPPNLAINAGGMTGVRRIRVFSRSSRPFNFDGFPDPANNGWQIGVFSGGINLIVEEVETGNMFDLVADRVVVWRRGSPGDSVGGAGFTAEKDQPLEFYLEGNVIVQQGNSRVGAKLQTRRLTGKQVYVNTNANQAVILDGSVETFDDLYAIPLYMNAGQIRQLTPTKFFADKARFTTSTYRGTPGYEFTANQVFFEETKRRITNPFTGAEVTDANGQPLIRTEHYATGYSSVLRVEDFPIFYVPYIRANVEDPLGPLEQVQIGSSNNLGFTTGVVLDAWQLIGLDYLPIAKQSDWLLDLGYHSERGFAGGTRFNYALSDLFGIPGRSYGAYTSWWIHDSGFDNLGLNREAVAPSTESRGRFRLQHHQELPNDFTFIGSFAWLSDSNLLESFFEAEYDSGMDQETILYLKQARNQWAWSALVQPEVRRFLPQNPWLPRLDGYLLGPSLFGDRATYFQHSSIGYAGLRPPPQYPLVGDTSLNTGRLDSRHELDLPLRFGPLKVTPYAIGQFTGYTRTPQAEDGLGRVYAAAGARASVPLWRTFPAVESDYLNLHGLAHKISFNLDYKYAYANRNYDELPLLDQLDDDTSEFVRRQNLLRQFGGLLPLNYDPRFFALRKDITFLPEILQDMQTLRFGVEQRLQTKRGPAENQHIIDWMTIDLGATYFPNEARDNFGKEFGLIDGNYEWHIGDRTSFTGNFLVEPYSERQSYTGGLYFMRPPRTLLALFFNHYTSGPFRSNYLGVAGSYRFSAKYAGSFSTGVDLSNNTGIENLSYSLGFSRVGLDFVTSLGIVYNAGRDDFGFQFEIFPRAQSRSRLARQKIPTLPFGVDPAESAAPIADDRLSVFSNNFGTN